jgi:hypothetical protein
MGRFVIIRVMAKWFRKYFVSHKNNGHHPHIFRTRGRLIILSSALLLEILFVASILVWTRTSFLADVVTSVIFSETNGDRKFAGLQPLTVSPVLEAAAQQKADDMAAKGYFAHVAPDGTTPWYWLDKVGYRFSAAGENLAVNFVDSTDVETAWMNSPKHRDNILNPTYTEVGIATSHATGGQIFVVEFFGTPTLVKMAKAPSKVSAVTSTQQENFLSVQVGEVKASAPSLPSPVVATQQKAQPAKQAKTPAKSVPKATTKQTPTTTTPRTFFQKLLQGGLVVAAASPRQSVNLLYYILIALVAGSLLTAIFTEIRIQRAAPILSGVLLIIILFGVVYVNFLVHTVSSIL